MSSVKPPFDVLATVDMGSNSFRLQISRVMDDQLYTLDSLKDTVRLGGGLQDDKTLDQETLQRALACMARFGERLRGLDPKQVRVVGTNTLRVAKNAPQFIVEAERLLGFPIEIIAGREEARLIYLGVSRLQPSELPRLVIDIGGGSTEIVRGTHEVIAGTSLDIGCVRLTERHHRTDPPTQEVIDAARYDIAEALDAAEAEDPMLVFNVTDQVRETIQQTLYSVLVTRRSVFF